MKWPKEILAVEHKNKNEKWLEILDNRYLPDEDCEVGVYQLKEIKKLTVRKTLE